MKKKKVTLITRPNILPAKKVFEAIMSAPVKKKAKAKKKKHKHEWQNDWCECPHCPAPHESCMECGEMRFIHSKEPV